MKFLFRKKEPVLINWPFPIRKLVFENDEMLRSDLRRYENDKVRFQDAAMLKEEKHRMYS